MGYTDISEHAAYLRQVGLCTKLEKKAGVVELAVLTRPIVRRTNGAERRMT